MSFEDLPAQKISEFQLREADPGIAEAPTDEGHALSEAVSAEAELFHDAPEEAGSYDEHDEEGLEVKYAESAEAVEDFFEQGKELFAKSVNAWQRVKAVQVKPEGDKGSLTKVIPSNDILHAGQKMIVNSSRTMRRHAERQQEGGERVLFSTAQGQGLYRAQAIAAHLEGVQGPIARRIALGEQLDALRDSVHSEIAATTAPHLAEWGADLTVAYTEAHFMDYEVNSAVAAFLNSRANNGDILFAFMDRLAQTAELARVGIVEYPGLLEALAANFAQFGEKSLLNQITKMVIGDPAAYAPEVAKNFIESDTRFKKELQVGSQLMQLVATQILESRGIDKEGFTSLFAAQWKSWPAPLAAVLKTHCDSKVNEYRQSIMQALAPFVRSGRLLGTGRKLEVDAKRQLVKPGWGGKGKPGRAVAVASKSQDMEDVSTQEAERQPITRFAWLSNTGTTAKQNVLRLDIQDSLDGILNQRNMKKYFENYKHVPNLTENIRAALEKLTTDPFDKTSTALWKNSVYYLEDNKKLPRHLRRFSLQDFPGVDGSSIAAKTRIAYAIVNNGGVPTLAVYGIFLKQDIEQFSGLPRRK